MFWPLCMACVKIIRYLYLVARSGNLKHFSLRKNGPSSTDGPHKSIGMYIKQECLQSYSTPLCLIGGSVAERGKFGMSGDVLAHCIVAYTIDVFEIVEIESSVLLIGTRLN